MKFYVKEIKSQFSSKYMRNIRPSFDDLQKRIIVIALNRAFMKKL